jgi:DNA-binding NarL/FixJ family response regulator
VDVESRSGCVLIVDDDSSFRALLSTFLSQAGYSTDEAATGEEAVARARTRPPAAVLLDVVLPQISGYEVCRQLREEFGDELPIVFVSGERNDTLDRSAGLLIGGDDYLVKPIAPDELLARVRNLLGRRGMLVQTRPFGLSKREREVLELLADGLSQKEIAGRLLISVKTVAAHIQNMLGKLGVHSSAQAVALAHREGILGAGSAP